MGITVTISSAITGVQGQNAAGFIASNQQRLSTVIGNLLTGSVASVGMGGAVSGVSAVSLLGTVSSSRNLSLTGIAATGALNTLSTGSAVVGWGFNLSGMEWAAYAFTRGSASTAPNRDFAVPRDELVQFVANRGFTKTRLPVLWEMLQPVLARQGAVSTVLQAYGIIASGQLCPRTVRQITQVLDAHAAAGIKCYIDIHNYCRYQDFIYNADGTVPGFTVPGGVTMPYSSTNSVQTRIFSSGASPTLTQADFADLWNHIANQWTNHAGLGGYMLMNEPHDLDANGTWVAYAQAAVNAIRAIDTVKPIYVGGNNYSNSVTIGTNNPGFPLTGANLIYEAHMYLDAASTGAFFDWSLEVAKGFSVGEAGAINTSTGFNRLKFATDWAASNNTKVAVTEIGMPLDDANWTASYKSATDLAWSKGVEVYTWMSGDHWPIHSYPINYAPGYYQGQSFEPKVGGVMKQSMGLNNFTLFDACQSYANGGSVVVTVTLFARGYVATATTVNLTRSAGTGTLSGASVVLPAGANPSVTYTYTTVANEKATITYSGPSQVPPARNIYSFTDPVGYSTGGIAAPVANAPSTATTGGTLAAATYFYKLTALNVNGETVGSNEVSIATTGTTSTVTVTWAAVPGATGYRVYRGTATGAENTYYAPGNVTTFTDTGAAGTAGSVPGTNTTFSLTDAGNALLAKYSAAKWVAVDAAKDYLGVNAGSAAAAGDFVRAVPDSGFASGPDNIFEMTNWVRTGLDYGTMTPPPKIVASSLHKLDTVGSTTWGSTMAQHVNPVLGNLSKVLAAYYAAYDSSLAITAVPTYFNVIYLFHLQFAGPNMNTNNNGDGTLTFLDGWNVSAAQVQTCRARGQKVILTVGGANNGYNITTRAQSTNFVNSFITIATNFGGVDGIDFNNFEANVGSSATELIWIVQQLRNRFGANFLVTAPPDGNSTTDQAMLQQMYLAGCLSWCAPQFYDWVGYDDLTLINNRLTAYRNSFNGDASAVMAGFPANNILDPGPTLVHCTQAYDTFAGNNPTFRGAMCWNAQINAQGSSNGNVWGLWCRKRDIKEVNGTEAIQPNGKEVPLFDIHDPHFVLAAVEVTNSTADGAIFSTTKSEGSAYSELGLTTGGLPTAKFLDFNANALSLQGSTGLTAGAHVVSMQSTGTAQTLRVDKVQVASGARTLSANAAIGSNSHTLGWRFYNYFERGTPGANIYGVIAGKGNPTTAELTVMERFLGNNYAGLSL